MSQSAESLRLRGGHLRASNLSTAEKTVESVLLASCRWTQMMHNQSCCLWYRKIFNSSPKFSSQYGLSLTFVIFVFFKCFILMYWTVSKFGSMSVYCIMCWPLAAKMQVQDQVGLQQNDLKSSSLDLCGLTSEPSFTNLRCWCIFITNALFSVSLDSEVLYLMPSTPWHLSGLWWMFGE